MEFTENIQKKVALVLTIFEYTAVSLLSIAIICRVADISVVGIFNVMGTAMVAFAPVAGIITAGLVSARWGKQKLAVYSGIILAVYIAAFLLAR